MSQKVSKRYSKDFGKKEKVLNYACQTYQLSRPNKVGAVMALIRQCQPVTIEAWEAWYFENAQTDGKNSSKITEATLKELGVRLYEKITVTVIPEWQEAFNNLTLQDCIDYIHNLTINRTFDGYIREKSVINDGLAHIFPNIRFEESPPELDHSGDVDYMGWVGKYAFGLQIKPVTAQSNFGNYSVSERMKASFADFESEYGGRVFIIFSIDGDIGNEKVLEDIRQEISRLQEKST
ncbi:MAG: MjaI family restriction endonuclease [Sphingobacteriales bacterium]|nr:MjaI family restriction endonuclease [Sphingobacteriales bacterium]